MNDIWSKSRRLFPQLDKYHVPKTKVLGPASESFIQSRPQMYDVYYHTPATNSTGYDTLRNEAIAGNPQAIQGLTRMALTV